MQWKENRSCRTQNFPSALWACSWLELLGTPSVKPLAGSTCGVRMRSAVWGGRALCTHSWAHLEKLFLILSLVASQLWPGSLRGGWIATHRCFKDKKRRLVTANKLICCCNPAQQHSLRYLHAHSWTIGTWQGVWAPPGRCTPALTFLLDHSWLVARQNGLWAAPCTQHSKTPLGDHSICHPQLGKQHRTMAKSKHAAITCWIVISFHDGLSGCAVSSYIHKTTFSVSCQNYNIQQEGICRKVLASVIHPFGFCMLGNNLYVQDHKLRKSQGQSFSQCTRWTDYRTLSPLNEHVPKFTEENNILLMSILENSGFCHKES